MLWWALSGLVVLGGLGLYVWYQRTPLAPGSLARRAPLPALMQLRRSTVLIAAALLLALCLGTVYLVRAWWPSFTRPTVSRASAPPPTSGPSAAFLDRFPTEYPMVAKPATKPLPPKGVPVPQPEPGTVHAAAVVSDTAPPPLSRAEVAAMIDRSQREALAHQQAMLNEAVRQVLASQSRGQQQGVVQNPEVQAQQRSARLEDEQRAKAKRGWAVAKPTSIQVGGEQAQAPTKEQVAEEKAQSLIHDAAWAKPADVDRTLYVDQFIPGILQDAVNSDIPGQLRVKVSRDVLDRNLRGTVLIPQLSTVIGKLEGAPAYGQTRLNVTLNQIIFPDGTVLDLAETKLGSADGSTGVAARVNNHWGKLIAGIGLSAILNIGVQSIGGTPGQNYYYRDPVQQAGQDAAQQLNNDVKSIVNRQLKVPPTLTVEAGKEVTLHLSQNINLSKAPILVR